MAEILRCPANYFGKGENYNIDNASPEEMKRHAELFDAWGEAHPEDPLGEIALEAYKREHTNEVNPSKFPNSRQIVTEQPYNEMAEGDWIDLRMTLPNDCIEALKRHARRNNRRPRDIVMGWIRQHCF